MKPPSAGRLSWTLPRGSAFRTFRAPAAGSPDGPHPFPSQPESLMQMPLAPGGRPGAATQAEPWTLRCLGGHTLSRTEGSLCRSGSPKDLTATPRHPTWSILAGIEGGCPGRTLPPSGPVQHPHHETQPGLHPSGVSPAPPSRSGAPTRFPRTDLVPQKCQLSHRFDTRSRHSGSFLPNWVEGSPRDPFPGQGNGSDPELLVTGRCPGTDAKPSICGTGMRVRRARRRAQSFRGGASQPGLTIQSSKCRAHKRSRRGSTGRRGISDEHGLGLLFD